MENELKNSKTLENLRQAYFEEASLTMRYKFFAIIAEFEGMDRYAELFRQYAEGGTVNTHGFLDFLRQLRDPSSDIPIGSTQCNLDSVLQTETMQFTETYPKMARLAREEGFTDIASWFDTLEKLKASHVRKLKGITDEK